MKKSFAFILMMLLLMPQGVRAENAKSIYFESNGISFLGIIGSRGGWEGGGGISLIIDQDKKRWVKRAWLTFVSIPPSRGLPSVHPCRF